MKKIHRSATGKLIDMSSLVAVNEDTIAVGNINTNARGDELGPGGKIVKSRNEVMKEYYKLNTPTAMTRSNTDRIASHVADVAVPDVAAPDVIDPDLSEAEIKKMKGKK